MCKYIIPIHGLSNRINWFAGLYCFNFINPCIFNKEKCVVYMKWTPDKECDGKFEDIFRCLDPEPIPIAELAPNKDKLIVVSVDGSTMILSGVLF